MNVNTIGIETERPNAIKRPNPIPKITSFYKLFHPFEKCNRIRNAPPSSYCTIFGHESLYYRSCFTVVFFFFVFLGHNNMFHSHTHLSVRVVHSIVSVRFQNRHGDSSLAGSVPFIRSKTIE